MTDENFIERIIYGPTEKGGLVIKTYANSPKEEALNRAAVDILADEGYKVKLVQASDITSVKSADAVIDGEYWEIKTNKTNTFNAVDRAVRAAGLQAPNLILNLMSSIREEVWKSAVSYRYLRSRKIKGLIVITNDNRVLTPTDEEIKRWNKKRLPSRGVELSVPKDFVSSPPRQPNGNMAPISA